jgi:hypothetical protein
MDWTQSSRWLTLRCFAATGMAVLCAGSGGCQRKSDLSPVSNPVQVAEVRKALLGEGAGGAAAAAGPVGTGWATLKGVFTYDGDPPEMKPTPGVNKDVEVCAPGGHAPPEEWLKVDPATKGVANIVLYARNAARVHDDAGPSTEPLVFDQKECVFLTHVFALTVDQPVTIKNSDPPPVGHNTNIEGQNKFNQTIPPGEGVPWSPKREEAAPQAVRCSIHPWMSAWVLPRKNAYFAVTAPDGTFEIPNLPAGEDVEIQVWHESAAGNQHALVVDTADAKALKWSTKGRFKIKLEENEVREIQIVVPPAAFRSS